MMHYAGVSETLVAGTEADGKNSLNLKLPNRPPLSACLQALGWVLNRGPLVRPLGPLQFLAVYSLPVTPREGAEAQAGWLGAGPAIGFGEEATWQCGSWHAAPGHALAQKQSNRKALLLVVKSACRAALRCAAELGAVSGERGAAAAAAAAGRSKKQGEGENGATATTTAAAPVRHGRLGESGGSPGLYLAKFLAKVATVVGVGYFLSAYPGQLPRLAKTCLWSEW